MRNVIMCAWCALLAVGLLFGGPAWADTDGGARALALQAQSLLNNLQVGQPTPMQIIREGFQLNGITASGNNSARSFAIGDNLGGLKAPPGRAIYIDSITCTSTLPVEIWPQRGNTAIIANGAVPNIAPIRFSNGGGTVTIAIGSILGEGENLNFVIRTAVPQNSTPDFFYSCGALGRYITNDFAYEAPKTMLMICDSICSTTGVNYGAQFWHAQVQQWLWAQGKKYRRIVKGDGGWASSHAEIYRLNGGLQVAQADLIFYALGMNEPSLAAFQANFPNILAWKQAWFPKSRMVILGPTPRQDGNEASVLAPIRSYIASTVATLGDPKVTYCNLGTSFSSSGDTYYFTADGTSSGTRIHPNAAGQALMATAVENCLTSSGVLGQLGALRTPANDNGVISRQMVG